MPARCSRSTARRKASWRAHAAVGAVVDVAGDDHEGGVARQRQVDQRLQRAQRGVAQQAGDPRVDALDALERRVEMEVSGVDEAVAHAQPTLRMGPDGAVIRLPTGMRRFSRSGRHRRGTGRAIPSAPRSEVVGA